MQRRLGAFIGVTLLLGVTGTALADSRTSWSDTPPAHIEVSLVTFGPGDNVHQYFGHNALLVRDTRSGRERMYNFGMFSFGADMLPRYLRGRLRFWVAALPVEPTFHRYVAMNRSIRVQRLDLPAPARVRLAARLAWHVRPENRSYLYHHYRNNCSTKLRDLIDEALGGALRAQHDEPARLTYRGHTRRYTEHDPLVHMLLVFWMNDSMEQPIRRWHEGFLPQELESMVADTRYLGPDGRRIPLVEEAYTVFDANRSPVPKRPSTVWPEVLAAGVALGGVALLLAFWMRRSGNRWARRLFGLHHVLVGLVCGVPGLVAFLFLFTEWRVTHWNENLFLVNPLTFCALPAGVFIGSGRPRVTRWMGWLWLILAASSLLLLLLEPLPSFDQRTWLPMALALPMNLGFAAGHWLLRSWRPQQL